MYSSPFYFQTGLVAYTHMCIFVLETSETLRTFYYLFNNDSIAVRGKIIRLHLKCLFWWLLIWTLIYDEIFLQMKLFMVLVNFFFSSNEKNIRFFVYSQLKNLQFMVHKTTRNNFPLLFPPPFLYFKFKNVGCKITTNTFIRLSNK